MIRISAGTRRTFWHRGLAESCYEGGGGVFFHEIMFEIVVDSSNGCQNALAFDRKRSFTLLGTAFTQTEAHRKCVRSSETFVIPFFCGITPPPTPPHIVAG